MSNLLNNFPSKLVSVVRTVVPKGHKYTARFEDGTGGLIRTSGRVYQSVTQIWASFKNHDRTDFLFSSKDQPNLKTWERDRFIVTIQVTLDPADQEADEYQKRDEPIT